LSRIACPAKLPLAGKPIPRNFVSTEVLPLPRIDGNGAGLTARLACCFCLSGFLIFRRADAPGKRRFLAKMPTKAIGGQTRIAGQMPPGKAA